MLFPDYNNQHGKIILSEVVLKNFFAYEFNNYPLPSKLYFELSKGKCGCLNLSITTYPPYPPLEPSYYTRQCVFYCNIYEFIDWVVSNSEGLDGGLYYLAKLTPKERILWQLHNRIDEFLAYKEFYMRNFHNAYPTLRNFVRLAYMFPFETDLIEKLLEFVDSALTVIGDADSPYKEPLTNVKNTLNHFLYNATLIF